MNTEKVFKCTCERWDLETCPLVFAYASLVMWYTMKKVSATHFTLLPLISHNDFVTFVSCINLTTL